MWKNIPLSFHIGNDTVTIKKIALVPASSGLAATLIPGGRTIHSILTHCDVPLCSIKKCTSLARVIREACPIIVDEAPMSNKFEFEALDRSLREKMRPWEELQNFSVEILDKFCL